jgi:predicted nucleic acid-binding protein
MSQSYVLDTSTVLNLIRGHELGGSIDRTYGLRSALYRHTVSIVSHGELLVLANRNQWGDQKRNTLDLALSELVTVNLDSGAMIDAYVRVEESCRNAPSGEIKMGQNDMWIAATALHTGLPLITTDKDFNHLDRRLIQVHWVDPSSGAPRVQ